MSTVDWLFVDMNSYFASCEQQRNPELRGKPVIVVPMMADSTCALAASYEAKQYGIKTGTIVADAKKMCPGLKLVEASHSLYTEYHHQIIEAVETCIPVGAVLSIDEMNAQLTGSQRAIPRAIEIAKEIKHAIARRVGEHLKCSIGLAPNSFLAKIATDLKKPDGLTILTRENCQAILSPLTVRILPGVGKKTEMRLNREGIYEMHHLYACSKQRMHDLWGGIVGDRFYDLIRGDTPYTPPTQTRSLGHEHVIEPKHRTVEGGLAILKKLLIKAAVRLRKDGYYAKRISLYVVFTAQQGVWEKMMKLDETRDTSTLLRVLETMWQDYPPEMKPFKVGVTLFDLVPSDQHQMAFFEDPRKEKLSLSVDAINERYGKDAITYASVHEYDQAAPTRIAFHRIPKMDEF